MQRICNEKLREKPFILPHNCKNRKRGTQLCILQTTVLPTADKSISLFYNFTTSSSKPSTRASSPHSHLPSSSVIVHHTTESCPITPDSSSKQPPRVEYYLLPLLHHERSTHITIAQPLHHPPSFSPLTLLLHQAHPSSRTSPTIAQNGQLFPRLQEDQGQESCG